MVTIEKCIIVTSPGGTGIRVHGTGTEATLPDNPDGYDEGSEVKITGNYITSAPRWYQIRRWWNLIRLISTGIQ